MADSITHSEPLVKRLYSIEELVELRRNNLRYARSFPPADERNRHRHVRYIASRSVQRREVVAGSPPSNERKRCPAVTFLKMS